MIIYGGTEEQVKEQLKCDHDWHGPCMDSVSRYMKCTKCFCLDRDIDSKEEYYEAIRHANTDKMEEAGIEDE